MFSLLLCILIQSHLGCWTDALESCSAHRWRRSSCRAQRNSGFIADRSQKRELGGQEMWAKSAQTHKVCLQQRRVDPPRDLPKVTENGAADPPDLLLRPRLRSFIIVSAPIESPPPPPVPASLLPRQASRCSGAGGWRKRRFNPPCAKPDATDGRRIERERTRERENHVKGAAGKR